MKPNNPFVISGYRGSEYFCDRVRETGKVVSALVNERNVTLMAPRRYGKTGLIRNVFHSLPEDYTTVYADQVIAKPGRALSPRAPNPEHAAVLAKPPYQFRG